MVLPVTGTVSVIDLLASTDVRTWDRTFMNFISNHSNSLKANTSLGQNSFLYKTKRLVGRPISTFPLPDTPLRRNAKSSIKVIICQEQGTLNTGLYGQCKKNRLHTSAAVMTSLPTTWKFFIK